MRDPGDLARYRALEERIRLEQATPILEWQGPGVALPAACAGAAGVVLAAGLRSQGRFAAIPGSPVGLYQWSAKPAGTAATVVTTRKGRKQ